jgi:tetratricopeptide (TPR) repeat protein
MAETDKEITGGSSPSPTSESQVFGDDVRLDVRMEDLFGGDLSVIRREQPVSLPVSSRRSSGGLNATHVVMILNVLVIAGLLVYFLKIRPVSVLAVPATVEPTTLPSAAVPAAAEPSTPSKAVTEGSRIAVTRHTAEALGEAISLQTARQLAKQGEFYKAAYVYDQLRLNINGSELKSQCLRDWLSLQMALCLQKTKEQGPMGECFTQALTSRSMVVRAMANYSLAVIQMNNRQYLESRSRAFGAISLLKIFEKSMPDRMEADCYFLAAESLTRYLFQMSNQGMDLPASRWSDTMTFYELPVLNQEQLSELLLTGLDQMEQAAIMPTVAYHPDRHVGSQWSVTCLDASLEQLLWQYASETKLAISWDNEQSEVRRKNSTVYMPFSDRRQIAEAITGSAGLVWRYDGEGGILYDPSHYRSFADIQNILTQEAISVWQRFLLQYRTDQRAANAHYCLGRLFGMMQEFPTSLGEYKLVSTQFYSDDLAPHAMLEASKIKAGLLDYEGSRGDLSELLIRYPNCKVVDTATLFLAEATLKSGLYEEACELFDRVWRMNIGEQDRCIALYGLGRCAYEMKNYQEAVNRLSQALKMTTDQMDSRIGAAFFLLGKSYIELGQYAQASGALKMALGKALDNREYMQIVVDLVEAECRQENYMQALTILESIPENRLNQEDMCRVMSSKARIYRDIDLPDTAISLLRRRIEFIAEAPLRAMLTVELAQCYMVNGDLSIAKKEMNDALYDLPAGQPRQQCCYLLAQTCYKLGQLPQAESHCVQAIQSRIEDEKLRAGVFGLLGQIYNEQKLYDKAAMAYAGILEQETVQ